MFKNLVCIADDFTGAGDWASFYAAGGADVNLYSTLTPDIKEEGVHVLARKIRSVPKDQAIDDVEKIIEILDSTDQVQIYYKYCSTFDSTAQGNIGPISDYILERLGQAYTVLCPSLPANGRTVRDGILYVNGVPLEQTHMRHHPLNPMKHSAIKTLMEEQSKYPAYILGREIYQDALRLESFLKEKQIFSKHFYLIPDYETDEDGVKIVECFGHLAFLTGGSGLAQALGKQNFLPTKSSLGRLIPTADKILLLSGSTSEATRNQVSYYINTGMKAIAVSVDRYIEDANYEHALLKELKEADSEILFYTDSLAGAPLSQSPDAAQQLESLFADLAVKARSLGYKGFLISGGETSGAVARALAWQSYHIGSALAPGVPLLYPMEDQDCQVIYKSGNFGQKDFYHTAMQEMRRGDK
jgi:uncharacterized protein YgbK (DUF1537 family)